ncbi:hypothetical protein JOF56_007130 [Kibdelosporangium banguiense]|uniref:Protein glutaminase domain-containing protein n=1 Tax=Kibdelosporangium banguiense TaxID=1365924 RepID=A0ABS4TQQ9_9PSEU|nr:protein-glutamine glutaminase family protein [Kibdelosporangium banguiense]MBP2326745.1 hypothetical protein [Kibdelosporangium banguiense]
MPRSNAVVGEIAELAQSRGAGRLLTVQFSGGQSGRLDLSDSRAQAWLSALDELSSAGLPAYVEIDPETSIITEVLVPIVDAVAELRDGDGELEVDLVVSHAKHRLPRDSPDYDELRRLLAESKESGQAVLVTDALDGHTIIDVRPHPKVSLLERAEAKAEPLSTPVTLAQAQQMFNLVNGRTACSVNPVAPGIPFTYPDDGCWGRAHEMARLMIEQGITPDKVWIYGNLRVNSANKPDCLVGWGWHVAPTLQVGTSTYVIDPALFTSPVPRATWFGVQGDPSATLVPTGWEVFHNGLGTYDPTFSQTNSVLATYRAKLQVRSASADGPPPYPRCQTNPPRVQWIGTIAGNTTARWFTYGWPSSWHVVWTMMPTSICSGAPQLSWSVAVERANATQSTYWITVKNQSAHTVRFEGRYDVLST